MKKIKIAFLLALLVISTAILCSCDFNDIFTSRGISVEIDMGDKLLTTDMTEGELRQSLKVTYERSILFFIPIDIEVEDYALECDYAEGLNNIVVKYDGISESAEGLFVDKTKISTEGDFLFCEINGFDYLLQYKGNDKNIVFPERAPYIIYDRLFYNNKNIESVKLGDSVIQIGDSAFAHSSIKSIDFGSGIEKIGDGAFTACFDLEYVNIPSVEKWCTVDFYTPIPLREEPERSSQTDFISDVYNTTYPFSDDYNHHKYGGYKATMEKGMLKYWTRNDKLAHTEYISVSNPVYFTGSIYLNNEKLEDVVIPDGVNKITIGFTGSDIKSLSIPNSVTSLSYGAFQGCTELEKIAVDYTPDLSTMDMVNRFSRAFDKDCGGFVELDGVYYIGNEENPYLILVGLADKNVTTVNVPDGTLLVCAYSLYYRGYNISEITLSDSVKYVGNYIVQTKSQIFRFTGGAGLDYIGLQLWSYSTFDVIIDIGEPTDWFFVDNDGAILDIPEKNNFFSIPFPLYNMRLYPYYPF